MVLEATIICIDNSEWMRNGDYFPSRFQAQIEAIYLLCRAKTQPNPENSVGFLTMAGNRGVPVLVTPTGNLGKIFACMDGIEISGEVDLSAGIQVAQMALKHRQNKMQRQRIIVFAGSSLAKYDKKLLEKIGLKLKKNSVAVDVVNFGEEEEGKNEKLAALVAAANNSDTCHMVNVPPGPGALVDAIVSSPIFTGDGESGGGFAAAPAGGAGFEFGVDPNLDPELALALRISMEEERARREAAAKQAKENQATPDLADDDETALLQQALALSMGEDFSANLPTPGDIDMSEAAADGHQDLGLALQLSVQDSMRHDDESSTPRDMSMLTADQALLSSILASLPGVDPNDPSVKDLLHSMQNQAPEDQEDKN